MRDAYNALLKFAAHDPVIATGVALLSLLVVLLGGLHVARIFGRFIVLVVQEFKHELREIGKALGRVWAELTTWKLDE